MNKFISAILLLLACVLHAEEKTKTAEFGKDKKHTLTIPETWTASEPGGMRQLEIAVPKQGTDKDDAEIAIFVFPAGGGVDANIKRWAGQFGGEEAIKGKRTLKTAGGLEATVVEIEGSYKGMGKNGPMTEAKENYKLLAAILSDGGDLFIKLTGPKGTVDADKAAFDKMIESYK